MTTALLAPPVVDDATRREFLTLLAAAGLLAGCGTTGMPDPTASPATRPVEHLAGTTAVPVSPQRIATLDDTIAVYLIQLGLPPAGAGDQLDQFLTDVAELVPPDLDRAAISTILTETEPNLEAIAALRPDLIIGTENQEDGYPRFTAIAPAVLVKHGPNGNWRPHPKPNSSAWPASSAPTPPSSCSTRPPPSSTPPPPAPNTTSTPHWPDAPCSPSPHDHPDGNPSRAGPASTGRARSG